MAILEQNWLLLAVMTTASLAMCWIGGYRKLSLLGVAMAALMALSVAIFSVNFNWLDNATATLVYGLLVIYFPLIELMVNRIEDRSIQ